MLEELRSLSDAKKKQVIIIATIIIMGIIISAWAVYFNSMIMGSVSQPTATTTTAVAPAVTSTSTTSGSGPWQYIENGFQSVVTIFKKPSQYNIQPQSN